MIYLKIIKKEREETNKTGAVSFKSYLEYFKAGLGYFGFFTVIALFFFTQAFIIAADYWLSLWLVYRFSCSYFLSFDDSIFKYKRATKEELFDQCVTKNETCDKIETNNLNQTLENYLNKTYRNETFFIYWCNEKL